MVDLIIIKERDNMNYVTVEIMETFGVTVGEALEIQEIMEESDLDFSECSMVEFGHAIRKAHLEWLTR